MSRVHPVLSKKTPILEEEDGSSSVLTVWKKSSMSFQGTDGFTVFDSTGRLAFRVDNYSRKNSCVKGGLVLMDGAGRPLITLKPQVYINR